MNYSRPDRPRPSGTRLRARGCGSWGGTRLRLLALAMLLVVVGTPASRAQYTATSIPPGYVQIQGDIITPETNAARLLAQMKGSGLGVQPNAVYAPSTLWPNRTVPYDFDSGVTPAERSVFLAAMQAWENSYPGATTVTFQPRSGEAGFLHLVVATLPFTGGSTDNVGYNGGQVTITIDPRAVATYLIAHEMGHALGLWHEQARSDRNNYVTIAYGNIASGYSSQFDVASPQGTFGPYDYDSIMHYGPCSFSACSSCTCPNPSCDTVQVVSPYNARWACGIGQLTHLSAMDQRNMAFMYAPPSWKFLYTPSIGSADGSYENPYTTLLQAMSSIPVNSTLWIGPGNYSAAGHTISTPMTLKAAIADLQLQPDGSLGPSPSGYVTLR